MSSAGVPAPVEAAGSLDASRTVCTLPREAIVGRPATGRRRELTENEIQRLREALSYDPMSGVFIWQIVTRNGHRRPGDRAGRTNNEGYWHITFQRKAYKCHRLAWLFVHDEWPLNDIDHINGDRSDNRISNLRLSTRQQNSWNRKRHKNNSCGFKGVHLHRKTGKWRANIRDIYIGLFDTPEQAHAAYCKKAEELFGNFARAK